MRCHLNRRRLTLAASVLILLAVVVIRPGGQPLLTRLLDARPAAAAVNGLGAKPYLGWSSWSMQSSHYPGLNPNGDYSWLNDANVRRQIDAMAAVLKPYGYQYINIDSGWWTSYGWSPGYDSYGRPTPNSTRFPNGMKSIADYIHSKGLLAGIYLPVGVEKGAVDWSNYPIYNASGCHTRDITYSDKRTTSGWDSSYKIDFSKPCAQKYIDSLAQMIAGWGYDFLKLDGVGPGSNKSGANYDNRTDVAAWSAALINTGRPIHFELSWSLDHNYIADWKKYANGWRIDTDVECYCNTLVSWTNSVDNRFDDASGWAGDAGPGGWNNLDAVDVGNGTMDGLSGNERQTYLTLWAISAAPLYTGDDLTRLDSYGLSLLTNTEVIALDQQGRAATKKQGGNSQVWSVQNADGSYSVALFNLSGSTATVTANWSTVGFSGSAKVRDLWSHSELGTYAGSFSASLPSHGSRLLKVTPGSGDGDVTSALRSQPADRCLDVTGAKTDNNTPVEIWDCNGQSNQQWTSTTASELRVYGTKCLDVPGTPAAGTKVEIWDCHGSTNQKWTFFGDGTIRDQQAGLCLDVFGAGTGNGTTVGLWTCSGQPNQKWSRS